MSEDSEPRKRKRSKKWTQKDIERMEKFDRWSMKAFYWILGIVALGGLVNLYDIRKERKEREEKHKKEMEKELWGEVNGQGDQAVESTGERPGLAHTMRLLQGRDDEPHRTH